MKSNRLLFNSNTHLKQLRRLIKTSYIPYRPSNESTACFPNLYSTSFLFRRCDAFGFRVFCDVRIVPVGHDLILPGMSPFANTAGVGNLIRGACLLYPQAISIDAGFLPALPVVSFLFHRTPWLA